MGITKGWHEFMTNNWKSVTVGLICYVFGFIFAFWCMNEVEKSHIKDGHTPYIDKNSGLMWQSKDSELNADKDGVNCGKKEKQTVSIQK